MFLTIRSREDDAKVLRFFNGFCFWSDRSITDAKRDTDRKLTRLRNRAARVNCSAEFPCLSCGGHLAAVIGITFSPAGDATSSSALRASASAWSPIYLE